MDTNEAREWAEGLIALGRYLLDHPSLLGAPTLLDAVTINVPCETPQVLAARIRELGGGEKYSDTGDHYSFTGVRRNFGPHDVDVYVTSDRVCTPKRTEPRSRPIVELTDEARAEIEAIRAQHTRMEMTEVVVEWECPPSLLAAGAETVSDG